ncbi:hypothetical protein F5882DRAFT_22836, partial [Hyaloscypha sp. PMI_1271]
CHSRRHWTSRHTKLELPPVHLREEAYSPLGRIIFQRVRIAGRVLPGNLRKIHPQDLSSFLYASKRYSSRSDHRLCLLVLERPCSPSLEHSSSSLLDSESLSLNPPPSLLLDGSLRDARAPVSTALPSWGRVRVVFLWIRPTSAVDTVPPPDDGWDEVYRLRPVTRNECCSIGLMLKSAIFPTWPMLAMSRVTWPKETPRSAPPSRITAVKEQQCGECGRNVTSVSVGRAALDDRSRLQQSGDMYVSVAYSAEGRAWGLGTAATLEA